MAHPESCTVTVSDNAAAGSIEADQPQVCQCSATVLRKFFRRFCGILVKIPMDSVSTTKLNLYLYYLTYTNHRMKILNKSSWRMAMMAPWAAMAATQTNEYHIFSGRRTTGGVRHHSLSEMTYMPTTENSTLQTWSVWASMGTMFTNAYACPVSTPTRTSLMTGMNATKMGINQLLFLFQDRPSDAIGGAPGTTNPNESDIFANAEWNTMHSVRYNSR